MMSIELIDSTDRHLTRRMILAPGESTPWHTDPCRRFSVVMSGDQLTIEFAGNREPETFSVWRGMSGWDEPDACVHRAVNTGALPFVEVVTFLRTSADVDVQPTAHPSTG